MDVQILISLIKVMKSLFGLGQNKVRFKAYNIMQEPSELVDFTPYLDIWP